MKYDNWQIIESIQKLIVTFLARHSSGYKLYLIGGFRFRFIDESCRFSRDIDYYWEGDLVEKQTGLIAVLNKDVIPEVSRQFAYTGQARAAIGPDSESEVVKTIDLAFWKEGEAGSRIEIPVDIMKFACLEKPIARTRHGVIVATPADNDLVEGKVVALLNRWPLQERDFIDLFLFEKMLTKLSGPNIKQKLSQYNFDSSRIKQKLELISQSSDIHKRAIDTIISQQLEPQSAAQLIEAGGGAFIFEQTLKIIKKLLSEV